MATQFEKDVEFVKKKRGRMVGQEIKIWKREAEQLNKNRL